ncbi:MAG: GTPase ObgE [Planctomycetota bacterium]|jgi:GTP-binding protein
MFQDVAELVVRAGDGGAGIISFRREKFIPKGGPDGGDGGRGGDVVFVADAQLSTFADCALMREYHAENGRPGEGGNRTGRSGEDLVLRVPPGTIVKDAERGNVLKDLAEDGARVVIARGGRGGRGNASFASATRQVPRHAEPGRSGRGRSILLELSLVADVGLIGLPNAGKSTLLSRISAARPKIADYPFTTLTPHLGVVRLDHSRSFCVADIPGLIEGAADGAGLGHRFLRHVERTKVLVHLVDGFPPEGAPTPSEAWRIVRRELGAFSEELAQKPEIVALTKTDLGSTESVLKSLRADSEREVCPISAVTGQGLGDLLHGVSQVLFRGGE